MEYASPIKLPDGRYYVKINNSVSVTEHNVKIGNIQDDMVVTLNDTSKISAYDEKLVADATEHSMEWFNRDIAKDVIVNYYQSALEDKILQVVASTNSKGRINIGLFSDTKEPLSTIEPGSICNVLLELDGLWFLKKSFGPVWKITQVRVKKQVKPVQCLIKDEDSDTE